TLAAQKYNITEIAIAGGVSANSGLRKKIVELGDLYKRSTYIPDKAYCTDNAGMIAVAAYYKFLKQQFSSQAIAPAARYSL
ncbi:MAG: tRNA (adenosine(37)-N6)-threonylcarbamoyltransferase complex transferase subunit TsaD, partial [Bacteroidetes bacterium]|nr:tRNA (adenosine(37)-N6)-threonylcarbamoyltransferase complex transferase subunit TsaD [Bacteroidota bacterium]